MGDGIRTTTNRAQLAVGVLVLLFGTLVYVLERPVHGAPFFSAVSLSHLFPGVFGPIGYSLPTFTHVFAISLLTAAWFGGGRRVGLVACLGWFGVDVVFEIGQYAPFAHRLAAGIPRWLDGMPILGRADSYFLHGTFDIWDLLSIALGAAAAHFVIRCTAPKERHDD